MKVIAISLFVALGILALGLSIADARQPSVNVGHRIGPEGFPEHPDVATVADNVAVIDLVPTEEPHTKHQAIVVWGNERVSVMLTRDLSRFQKQAQEWVASHHPGAKIYFVPSGAEMMEIMPPEAGGPPRTIVP